MSLADFRKTFFPSKEETEAQLKKIYEIHNKCVEDRKTVNLVSTEELFLYRREPFDPFLGDCVYCSHYIDGGRMVEGGWCKLHKTGCGWGFTCKDNDSEWAVI